MAWWDWWRNWSWSWNSNGDIIVTEDEPLKATEEIESSVSGDLSTISQTATPNKYALLVGINEYPTLYDGNLYGCVNDSENMFYILTEIYGFKSENIRMLTDSRATRVNIINGLKWLIRERPAGSELVFCYSGHGSQVVDLNGDELSDGLDEILLPYNNDWDNCLTDDVIHQMFKYLHPEAYLTFICDSCCSGTMTRSIQDPRQISSIKKKQPRFVRPPVDIDIRSIKRENDLHIIRMGERDVPGPQRHVLAAACQEWQSSTDTEFNIGWGGAFTCALMNAIYTNPNRSWTEMYKEIYKTLEIWEMDQTPRLSGDKNLTEDRPIFGGPIE